MALAAFEELSAGIEKDDCGTGHLLARPEPCGGVMQKLNEEETPEQVHN